MAMCWGKNHLPKIIFSLLRVTRACVNVSFTGLLWLIAAICHRFVCSSFVCLDCVCPIWKEFTFPNWKSIYCVPDVVSTTHTQHTHTQTHRHTHTQQAHTHNTNRHTHTPHTHNTTHTTPMEQKGEDQDDGGETMVEYVERYNHEEEQATALMGGQDDNRCTFGNVRFFVFARGCGWPLKASRRLFFFRLFCSLLFAFSGLFCVCCGCSFAVDDVHICLGGGGQ